MKRIVAEVIVTVPDSFTITPDFLSVILANKDMAIRHGCSVDITIIDETEVEDVD